MVELRGKRGNRVPIILTPEAKEAVDTLMDKRETVGISKLNPYVFAKPASTTHIRFCETLRKITTNEKISLKHPELITSTRLRKYIATVSQVMDLDEKELDWLARHMGHDIRIHREFYRLHHSTIELTKVGKLLTAVDQGKVGNFTGMSLDDISLDMSPGEGTYL